MRVASLMSGDPPLGEEILVQMTSQKVAQQCKQAKQHDHDGGAGPCRCHAHNTSSFVRTRTTRQSS